MILERTVLHCPPGTVGKVVENFKGMEAQLKNQDVIKSFRILTDLSGPFDTVVIESEIESIDAYLALLKAMFNAEASEEAASVESTYNTGHRTFYTIEAQF